MQDKPSGLDSILVLLKKDCFTITWNTTGVRPKYNILFHLTSRLSLKKRIRASSSRNSGGRFYWKLTSLTNMPLRIPAISILVSTRQHLLLPRSLSTPCQTLFWARLRPCSAGKLPRLAITHRSPYSCLFFSNPACLRILLFKLHLCWDSCLFL